MLIGAVDPLSASTLVPAAISAVAIIIAGLLGRQVHQSRGLLSEADKTVTTASDALLLTLEEVAIARHKCEEEMIALQKQHALLQSKHGELQRELERLRIKIYETHNKIEGQDG